MTAVLAELLENVRRRKRYYMCEKCLRGVLISAKKISYDTQTYRKLYFAYLFSV